MFGTVVTIDMALLRSLVTRPFNWEEGFTLWFTVIVNGGIRIQCSRRVRARKWGENMEMMGRMGLMHERTDARAMGSEEEDEDEKDACKKGIPVR